METGFFFFHSVTYWRYFLRLLSMCLLFSFNHRQSNTEYCPNNLSMVITIVQQRTTVQPEREPVNRY